MRQFACLGDRGTDPEGAKVAKENAKIKQLEFLRVCLRVLRAFAVSVYFTHSPVQPLQFVGEFGELSPTEQGRAIDAQLSGDVADAFARGQRPRRRQLPRRERRCAEW